MLQSLHIENAAVIKYLDVDFRNGFSVMTGETGAGKSIIIDSINMLSGNRVSKELIRSGEDKAIVSAVFTECGSAVGSILEAYDIEYDGSVMLSRSLSKDGKSVVKLNGRTITQSLQREICRVLINIHGQNDNQRLMQKSSQIEILDSYAENQALLSQYGELYQKLLSIKSQLEELNTNEAEKMRMRDMLRFQLEEIQKAKLKADDEEELLEAERKRLGNIEKITEASNLSYRILYGSEKGVVPLIDRACNVLSKISSSLPEAGEFAEKLSGYRHEIADIAEQVRDFADEDDPTEKLNRIEGRLDIINKLKRKYGPSVQDVMAFRDRAMAQLEAIENADDLKVDLQDEYDKIHRQATEVAEKLHQKRTEVSRLISKEVMKTLTFLDMPKVFFDICIRKSQKLLPVGVDDIDFLISANPGEPPMPLEKIASGGELSRIMLALKSVLSDKDGVGTVVFDEVDTGISGKTSRKVGIKLKHISKSVQVLCVTHSAQIASLADTHFQIAKHEEEGRTQTEITQLDDNGRVLEVARILGGIEVTQSQMSAAQEMIEDGKQY